MPGKLQAAPSRSSSLVTGAQSLHRLPRHLQHRHHAHRVGLEHARLAGARILRSVRTARNTGAIAGCSGRC
eukprot:1701101-Alexandrium_andersonii.AAC.1